METRTHGNRVDVATTAGQSQVNASQANSGAELAVASCIETHVV